MTATQLEAICDEGNGSAAEFREMALAKRGQRLAEDRGREVVGPFTVDYSEPVTGRVVASVGVTGYLTEGESWSFEAGSLGEAREKAVAWIQSATAAKKAAAYKR